VTIISALAGSGKTSLLRAWAVRGSRAGSPCCAGKLMELRNAER
jgi:predicted ATPase